MAGGIKIISVGDDRELRLQPHHHNAATAPAAPAIASAASARAVNVESDTPPQSPPPKLMAKRSLSHTVHAARTRPAAAPGAREVRLSSHQPRPEFLRDATGRNLTTESGGDPWALAVLDPRQHRQGQSDGKGVAEAPARSMMRSHRSLPSAPTPRGRCGGR